MDEELRLHVERQIEQNLGRGLPPEQARRAALLGFGNVDAIKEECRDSWGVRMIETLVQDVRYGARSLRGKRGFALVVIATLGLGIGANSAIFSVVRGVLLRPLPYADGERLAVMRLPDLRSGNADLGFSVPELADLGAQVRGLDGLVEYHSMSFTLFGGSEPERVQTGVVSAGFFDVLGVRPLLGRTFLPGEDAPGSDPVLVLSHEYWQRSLGGDPRVIGRRFEMNDRVHTVVGVLPPLPRYPDGNDVFMPASACPFRTQPAVLENRSARMASAFARVKPGRSLEQVEGELQTVLARLKRQFPDAYPPSSDAHIALAPLQDELVRAARPTLLVLLGTVALILLIACANVANLTLARMADRGRELGIRAALGAGRGRILRQLLTESTLLALCGGALGLLLAWAARGLLVGFAARFTPRAGEIQVDGSVLAFTLVLSLLTGVLFGTLPGLPRRELARAVIGETGRATTGPRRERLRAALAVSQLALSFMLLIGAALMLRSFAKLQQVDAGFRSDNVLTMSLDLNWSAYRTPERGLDRERTLGFHDALHARVSALPGVIAVGNGWTFPLNNAFRNEGTFRIEGRPTDAAPATAEGLGVSPGYFEALGTPLVRGRYFDDDDRGGSPGVVIVSQGLARRHWGAEDPVGRRLTFDEGRTWQSVVGVVGDIRHASLDKEPKDYVYVPFLQFPSFSSALFVRTLGDPLALAKQVRQVAHGLDPEVAIVGVRSLDQIRHESLASTRLTTLLLALFAALAVSITAAGLGGVIGYSVSQRTQEIGVRMALGAAPRQVLGMVLGQGLRAVLLGVGLGVLGALALARLASGLLFGVAPTDPLCFAGSAAVLLAVAAAACLVPARRAVSIDPMIALRTE
jgi:predicted permease